MTLYIYIQGSSKAKQRNIILYNTTTNEKGIIYRYKLH